MEYPEFQNLVNVIAKLRHPVDGCPWDLKQTHQSLLKYLVEETYEYVHAVEKQDFTKMEEELGDVLLQVLLHSQIASENDHFDIESVSKTLARKMIERHPHVFKDKSIAQSADEVSKNWEEIKQKDSENFFKEEDVYMPSLMAADKIGAKSAKVNFDWDTVEQVYVKVEEELGEVLQELREEHRSDKRLKEEVGDLLFSVAQLSRHLGFDPEDALREANKKFINRFSHMENKAKSENKNMKHMNVEQLEQLWQETKKELKK
ncbi:MAG: nucleoside triphosphate pyrophosphohydrolase [Bacteriovoracaceae bacterium]|nr:nucleoside triphosphate pyrophosphohydrolase [Bacteriovoracaceae bacterium]